MCIQFAQDKYYGVLIKKPGSANYNSEGLIKKFRTELDFKIWCHSSHLKLTLNKEEVEYEVMALK